MRQESFMPNAYKVKALTSGEYEAENTRNKGTPSKTNKSRKQSTSSKYSYDKRKEVDRQVDKVQKEGEYINQYFSYS